MDPVTLAIVSAVIGGVATAIVDEPIKDAYEKLKSLIWKKKGENSGIIVAADRLAQKPESKARQAEIQEEVQAAGADKDPEILAAAQALLDKLQVQPEGKEVGQNIAHGTGIAQVIGSGKASVKMNEPPKEQND